MNTHDWQRYAECAKPEHDPELWFPIGTNGAALLQAEEAKAVCRRCPVIKTCLQWALKTGQETGVLGGMDEAERRSEKRRAARRASKARAAA